MVSAWAAKSIWIPSFIVFLFLPIDLWATVRAQPCDTYFFGCGKNSLPGDLAASF